MAIRSTMSKVHALWVSLLATQLGGCSYLLMEPPPPQHARLDTFQCRTSFGTPSVDVLLAANQVLAATLVAAIPNELDINDDAVVAYAAPSVVLALVHTASAIYGFQAASDCNAALNELALRLGRDRVHAAQMEQFYLEREHARARQTALESNVPQTPPAAPVVSVPLDPHPVPVPVTSP